jgi:hypothetical protein
MLKMGGGVGSGRSNGAPNVLPALDTWREPDGTRVFVFERMQPMNDLPDEFFTLKNIRWIIRDVCTVRCIRCLCVACVR